MESVESVPVEQLKSKKIPESSSLLLPSDRKNGAPDQIPWSTKTPEKPTDLSVAKSKKSDKSKKLPEKYDILDRFFNSLDSSIRLLRLKGSISTFTNISPKIECLTDRRFSYCHLAQLKFILPEAIEIKKVLLHDENTCCMKPDLHVALNANAVENDGNGGHSQLRKTFRARLLNFVGAHPEEDEVPQETLPEPFNYTRQYSSRNMPETEAPIETPSEQPFTPASHLPPSFRRHFSKQASCKEAAKTNQAPSIVTAQTSTFTVSELNHSPSFRMMKSLDHDASSTTSEDCCFAKQTPTKRVLTPAKLMSVTPALQPPKRCSSMSPDDDDDDDSTVPSNKLLRGPSCRKSLNYVKADFDNDILEILPENLLQSIREKEIRAQEEKDPAISLAKQRQRMIAGLPKLFDTIVFLFSSMNRSVITKQDLIYRIIASNLDIIERREVEEKLRLLKELVPDWISEKSALSGDQLLCVNKMCDHQSIRSRLAEAK